MPQLLKCPFCGGEAQVESLEIAGMRNPHFVRCLDCGAQSWPWLIGYDIAIKAWNRRDGVVHCKDCKNAETAQCPLVIIEHGQLVFVGRNADFFCADGVSKEVQNDEG